MTFKGSSKTDVFPLVEDDSFSFHRAKKGDLVYLGSELNNSVVFMLSGEIEVFDSEDVLTRLKTGYMYNLSIRNGAYSGRVLIHTEYVKLNTSSLVPHISAFKLQDILNTKSTSKEKMTKLELGPVFYLYVKSVKSLKQKEIETKDIYDLKKLEFLYYLKEFYTNDQLACFFSHALSKYTNFRLTVYSKYTFTATVGELADSCYMTPKTFSRRFNTEFGMAPHKWLIQQKIKNLKDLLFNKGMPFDDILELFEFSSKAEFRQFCIRYKLVDIINIFK